MATEPISTVAETKIQNWVWVEPDEQRWDKLEPAHISVETLMALRNGLIATHSLDPYKNTMVGTMLYRAAIDLDHAARLMKSLQGNMNVTIKYTTKPLKKSAKKKVKRGKSR